MQSVLSELTKLRKGNPVVIDYSNINRYRLVVCENDGSKTTYYFSTPIYNSQSRKMVDLQFHSNEGTIFAVGSNANITISEKVRMENAEESCVINLPQKVRLISNKELHCGMDTIYPAANGIAYKAAVQGSGKTFFDIEVGQPFLNVRFNDRLLYPSKSI